MTSEANLMRRLQIRATKLGARLFRNNVAQAWVGDAQRFEKPTTITAYPGDVLIRRARVLHAGLHQGSSDLIGCTPYVVPSEWVGKSVAVFTAVEVKSPDGRLSPEQVAFLGAVRTWGGLAIVARAESDIEESLREYQPAAPAPVVSSPISPDRS